MSTEEVTVAESYQGVFFIAVVYLATAYHQSVRVWTGNRINKA